MKYVQYVTDRASGVLLKEKRRGAFAVYDDALPPFAEGGAHTGDIEGNQLRIYPQVKYRRWKGFGGAFTEASALAWLALGEANREKLIKAYFSQDEGIGYNFGRTAIGSCDFSSDAYCYVENNDLTLASFSLERDENTVFRMIAEAKKYCADLELFSSPWSPPPFMKDNLRWQGGKLKSEYANLYARYIGKYIEECGRRGIKISAVTVQNEPRHHQIWESCLYTKEEELDFVKNSLAAVLKPLGVKIYVYDHCKERVFERACHAFGNFSDLTDGIACHWYSGDYFEELRMTGERFPDKEIIISETCCALQSPDASQKEQWDCADKYSHDIFGNMNNGATAFCDWNLTLNEARGPYHFREGRKCVADAPVISRAKDDRVELQPSYYHIGHFSKFIRRGAHIAGFSKPWQDVEVTAAVNPDGSIVAVMQNKRATALSFIIHIGDKVAEAVLEGNTLNTFVID